MLVTNYIALYFVIFGSCNAWRGHIEHTENSHVETVDNFNSLKFLPRLASLLHTNYFRFYRINLHRKCPFWPPDPACASKNCNVKACQDSDVPAGIREFENGQCSQAPIEEAPNGDLAPLGDIDKTLEPQQVEAFQSWKEYDDAQYDFCELSEANDTPADEDYVDLTLNPERFTGYKGPSTQRIWRAIYAENCFNSESEFTYGVNDLNQLCQETRLFYRLVSGLHTSITVHLCAKYFSKISETSELLSASSNAWGPNYEEFQKRFDNKLTGGQGASRLRNLYLLFLVELRALSKISHHLLENESFFTGDNTHDEEVRLAVADLMNVVNAYPEHFNESALFAALGLQAKMDDHSIRIKLRDEFRDKFRNITRIMACVGCDKCKLWGTLQTHGLGTALKILFWPNDQTLPSLKRHDIVALFNAIGRLSTSIQELETFAHILDKEYNQPQSFSDDIRNEL